MLKHAKTSVLVMVYAGLAVILLVSIVLAINIGAVDVSPAVTFRIIANKLLGNEVFPVTWSSAQQSIIWNLRMPKVLVAGCVGAGLSLAGIFMQALTKNPLADPYILGISSGASTGATFVLLVGSIPLLGSVSVSTGAFIGALVTSVLVFCIAGKEGQNNTTKLVLVGMAVSAFFSALTNFVIFITPDSKKVNSALFWMTGSFSGILWSDVLPAVIALALGLLAAVFINRELDALLMGEEIARSSGVDTSRIKIIIILVSTLLTGVMVSMSGIIGFVGLVIPHICRSVVGASHRRLVPLSLLLGASYMIWADVIARVCVAPEEIPVGVITALAGVPFFLVMLKKSRYDFGRR